MLNFLNPKISSFGIDLSDLSIKIAYLKKKRGVVSLASFSRQEIPSGLIEEGEIKKEDELIEVIKKAVREVKGESLKNLYCVASLPEIESYVRMVKLPAMKPAEATEAIKWEIEANIPLKLEEIYYDWQIIADQTAAPGNQPAEKLDVLIGVLPKKTVDPHLSVLKKAGLKPLIFEIESVAIARALIEKGQCVEPTVIVDLGAQRTNLVIFCGQTIFFTSSLPISNNSLVNSLSEQLKITPAKAREIKIKIGLDFKHQSGRVFQEFKKPLTDMAAKITSYIDFFHEHIARDALAGKKVGRLILCGGGANMAGLPEFLSSQMQLEVVVGNPWINILDDPARQPPGLSANESLTYTTALGLALHNIEPSPKNL